MNKSLKKDTARDIKKSLGRFISILSIVALGVAFFTGVKVSPIVMKSNADRYYDENNLMDIRLLSTLGLTNKDVEEISKIQRVRGIEPAYFNNFIATYNSNEMVVIAHSIPSNNNNDNNNYINRVTLKEGRMPTNPGECLVENSKIKTSQIPVGAKIKLSTGTSEAIGDVLKYDEYEVVGTVETPYYLSFEKGRAPIGNGTISNFIMIPEEDFKSPAYSEIFITVDGAKELDSYKDEYFNVVDNVSEKLKNISKERNNIRYTEVREEALKKLNEGKKELEKNEALAKEELDKAEKGINEGKRKIAEGENKLKNEESQYNQFIKNAENELKKGKEQLKQGEEAYNKSLQEFNTAKPMMQEALKNLNGYIIEQESQLKILVSEKDALEEEYEKNPTEEIRLKIEELKNKITSMEETINSTKVQLQEKQEEISLAEAKLSETKIQLDTAKNEINKKANELEKGKETAIEGFKKAKEEIQKGKEELVKGEKEYLSKKQDVEKELKIAKEKIVDSEKSIDNIEMPEWIILDRNSHYSYVDYKNSADSIDALAAVFPVFFFLVAALVCLTTMTRMVDEQRVNIGTLKALGYSKASIAAKFIIYALLASLIGSFFGLIVGFTVFPTVVFKSYEMMYSMPQLKLTINIPLAIGSTLVAVLVTTLAAYSACNKELKETPSVLMRPKAPKEGKRILIERIPFIWNKLNFIGKVTVRNIFRYKKRFFMTVFGIAGCTALLLTGFGIKDSVKAIVDKQFGEIFTYHTEIALDKDIVNTQKEDINKYLQEDSRIKSFTYMSMENGKVIEGNTTKEVSIVVPENINTFGEFLSLHDRKSKDKVILDNNGVVITEKVANQLNVDIGDTIILKDKEEKEGKVVVTGITENYLSHYIYISKEYYKKVFDKDPVFSKIYTVNSVNDNEEKALSKDIIELDGVVGVNFTSSIKNTFGDTIKSLNLVIVILIISAGALAFVVLYNLTNVNISERMREIATIKVLGFYDNEVSAYIYRENIILTIIGAISGLGLGIILHRFIMITVELDNMMFGRNIDGISFILSLILTLGFSLLVNLTMYYKLKNVKMVESLKSVD